MLDPGVAVHTVEGEREDPAADQNEEDEAGQPRGGIEGIAEQGEAQPPLGHGDDQRPQGDPLQVDPQQHRPGLVVHSQGWPLDARTGALAWKVKTNWPAK
mgnify:CR=1 FL=1